MTLCRVYISGVKGNNQEKSQPGIKLAHGNRRVRSRTKDGLLTDMAL
jgi:hypothetical protein